MIGPRVVGCFAEGAGGAGVDLVGGAGGWFVGGAGGVGGCCAERLSSSAVLAGAASSSAGTPHRHALKHANKWLARKQQQSSLHSSMAPRDHPTI